MRHLVLIWAFILTLFVSCTDKKYSDKDVEQQANKIIKLLDKSTIDTFKHWGYGRRGEAEIWAKLDTPTYGCFYFYKDTLKLSVGLIENFKTDFPYSINIDTSKVHQIIFKKISDENINVSAWTNFGGDTIIVDKIKLKDLFKEKDPRLCWSPDQQRIFAFRCCRPRQQLSLLVFLFCRKYTPKPFQRWVLAPS